jgi:3-hydroxymyristoyl/3-hydroxydecanoyl-(acyl carrier protein) dehydratase
MRFRFIDRVLSFERGDRSKLVTTKAFTESDEYTAGFPQRPGEIPNCLILESLATAGVHLVYCHSGETVVGVLLRVQEAKISSPVGVGEEIVVRTELLGLQPSARDSVGVAQTAGSAYVGERKVAEARLVLLCFPKNGFETALPW